MRKSNKTIQFSPPNITKEEIKEVSDTLTSGWITTGKKTKLFEKKIAEYIGVEKAVCLNSATASMELTLRLLGVGPGDEVITTAYTYTATAAVISHVGAKIRLVDTSKDSFEMDYTQLEKNINEKTKVIIPVDIAGKMCDYEKIFEVVERKKYLFNPSNELQKKYGKVIVMSDSAHGFGASQNGKKSGTIADFTCFSFHAVKNLTTSEGGAVVWKPNEKIDSDWIYKQFMLLSLHGQSKDAFSKSQLGSWEYDVVHLGYKCNMTDIAASIGLIQLEKYPQILKRRKVIVEKYNNLLKDSNLKVIDHYSESHNSSGHLYLLRIKDLTEERRNAVITKMAEKGITCNVHYKPLPMLTAYKKIGFNIEDFPNAYEQYKNLISLPLHTSLNDDDIDYIVEMLNESLMEI